MAPEEQAEYAEIICNGFKENEIEHLETYAEYGFNAVERGVPIKTAGPLILDRLKELEEGSEDE